jgi:hypothetical protein
VLLSLLLYFTREGKARPNKQMPSLFEKRASYEKQAM